MRAVIQFCSEVPLHLERTALLKLNSLSWQPEKKHWREKKKRKKETYFPDQSDPYSIAMAADVSFFFSLTRRGSSQQTCFIFFFFFV